MKKIFFTITTLLYFGVIHCQVRLISKVGTYSRVASDGTDYESLNPPCDKDGPLISTETFQGYEESSSYPGMGEVTYYYKANPICPSGGKSNLTKPIIITDGFDPGDNNSGAEIYGHYLKYDNGQPILLGNILRKTGTNEIGGTDGYDIVILNFPQYSRISGGTTSVTYPCPIPTSYPNQAQICTQIGYPYTTTFGSPEQRQEIDGGTDYIERNAMVLIELIRNTNATLKANGSAEKIVLIGPSMGGLISRYALAFMEKQLALNPNDPAWKAKWDHNCRLWVSFDGPHLGANIPIGAQEFLKFFGEDNENDAAKRSLDNKIRSVAAKQLLLHHELGKTAIASGAPGFRDRFVSTMNNIGYPNPTNDPAKLRKIALTNGSINSTKFAPNDCQTVLTMQSFWTVENFLFKYFSQHLLADATIKYSGSYGNGCETFKGYYAPRSRNSVFSSAPSTTYSYDNGPGGYYNTLQILSDQGKSDFTNVPKLDYAVGGVTLATGLLHTLGFLGSGNSTHFNVNIGIHSFIPTKSSLAFKGTNPDFGEDLSGRSLVCTGETPFDSYYSPLSNENHVSLTQKSVDYVLSEIRGIPRKPLVIGQSITSTGGLKCNDASSRITFSVPQQTGTIYNWTVTSGAVIESGEGTNTIVVKSINNDYTIQTVNLSATTNCSNIIFNPKTFQDVSGFSSSDYPVSGPDNATCNGFVSYRTNQLTGATNYMWIYPSGATNVSGQGTNQLSFTVPPGTTGMQIGVRVANICDAGGSPAFKFTSVTCPSGIAFTVSPNPAGKQLNIQNTNIIPESTSSLSKQTSVNPIVFDVKLFDKFQQVVKTGTSQNDKLQLDVSNLSDGMYYLHILQNGEVIIRQHIIIQK